MILKGVIKSKMDQNGPFCGGKGVDRRSHLGVDVFILESQGSVNAP